MENILTIDTSDNKKVNVKLKIGNKKEIKISKPNKLRSQATLLVILEALNKGGIAPKNLNSIKVNRGPGSFTGLRIGVSIANAFSYLLKIPVNSKKIGDLESEVYN